MKLWSHDLRDLGRKLRRHNIYISKYVYFKKAIFGDFIKIRTMFFKIILKGSKNVKKNYKLCIKMQSITVFLMHQKLVISIEKNVRVSRTQMECQLVHIFF